MRGIIYKYTNILNGKCYIGQTTNEQKRKRKWNKPNESYAGKKIELARKKYGLESFEYNVLFEIISEDKDEIMKVLNQMETYYIKKYDSFIKRI